MSPERSEIDVHLYEYWKLKDEQAKRIEFRDTLIHVHLALVGAAIGWGLTHGDDAVLLVVPWICLIIGWTYVVNDDRTTALARYFAESLAPRLSAALGSEKPRVLEWEFAHQRDDRRSERKVVQLIVDLITFIAPGLLAIARFAWKTPPSTLASWTVVTGELLLMLALTVIVIRYANFSSLPGAPDSPAGTKQNDADTRGGAGTSSVTPSGVSAPSATDSN
jgi:hypothetical protein